MYKEIKNIGNWDFVTANTKEYTHIYHSYPAMMIPQIARRLIKEFKTNNDKILFDPYCGSGTSLVEGILSGINSYGTDLNPLARLIARVKTTEFNLSMIKLEFKKIIHFYESNQTSDNPNLFQSYDKYLDFEIVEFDNIDFWFSKEIKIKLSLLVHILNYIVDKDVKEFFFLPFSETVREVSFTRNSEFKLFRIKEEKRNNFNPNILKIFSTKVLRNITGLEAFLNMKKNNAKSEIFDFNTCNNKPSDFLPDIVDLIVTSPPYGDSRTTVAYGQYSRLSSQWLGLPDAKKIDNLLMGGCKYNINEFVELDSSKIVLNEIKNENNSRFIEVQSFLADYYKSIMNLSESIKKGGYVCYVLGNRTVKGRVIPLDKITVEIFNMAGFIHYDTYIRNIPNKRMPSKNSPSNITGMKGNTMTNEYIVIMQKQ